MLIGVILKVYILFHSIISKLEKLKIDCVGLCYIVVSMRCVISLDLYIISIHRFYIKNAKDCCQFEMLVVGWIYILFPSISSRLQKLKEWLWVHDINCNQFGILMQDFNSTAGVFERNIPNKGRGFPYIWCSCRDPYSSIIDLFWEYCSGYLIVFESWNFRGKLLNV